MEFMRQCILARKNITTVGWIDEKKARVGNMVTLTEEAPEEVWRISMVGTHRITKADAHKTRSDVFGSIKPKV